MNVASRSMIETAERLCEVLERIASALVALDNDALLEAEVTLAELVGAFESGDASTGADAATVEATVRRGRVAMMRCRRLGASFTSIARARLATRPAADLYNRDGAVADPLGSSPTVQATI